MLEGDTIYQYYVRKFRSLNVQVWSYRLSDLNIIFVVGKPLKYDPAFYFSIVVPTPAGNAPAGASHITEHVVLEGSKRYKVSKVFDKLHPRVLAKLMNAATYPTRTMYYFSTYEWDDFKNIARVYLDAVFNPLLKDEAIHLEGFRKEIRDGRLQYNGVVFNEMKAGIWDYWRGMYYQIFDIVSSMINVGDPWGYPIDIVKTVTPEQIREFYSSKYNLTNAVLVLSGPFDSKRRKWVLNQVAKVVKTRGAAQIETVASSKGALVKLGGKRGLEPVDQQESVDSKVTVWPNFIRQEETAKGLVRQVYYQQHSSEDVPHLVKTLVLKPTWFKDWQKSLALYVAFMLIKSPYTWINKKLQRWEVIDGVTADAFSLLDHYVFYLDVWGKSLTLERFKDVSDLFSQYLAKHITYQEANTVFKEYILGLTYDFEAQKLSEIALNAAWDYTAIKKIQWRKIFFPFKYKNLPYPVYVKAKKVLAALMGKDKRIGAKQALISALPHPDLITKTDQLLEELRRTDEDSLTPKTRRQLMSIAQKVDKYAKHAQQESADALPLTKLNKLKGGVPDLPLFEGTDYGWKVLVNNRNVASIRLFIPLYNANVTDLTLWRFFARVFTRVPPSLSKEYQKIAPWLFRFQIKVHDYLSTLGGGPSMFLELRLTFSKEKEKEIARFIGGYIKRWRAEVQSFVKNVCQKTLQLNEDKIFMEHLKHKTLAGLDRNHTLWSLLQDKSLDTAKSVLSDSNKLLGFMDTLSKLGQELGKRLSTGAFAIYAGANAQVWKDTLGFNSLSIKDVYSDSSQAVILLDRKGVKPKTYVYAARTQLFYVRGALRLEGAWAILRVFSGLLADRFFYLTARNSFNAYSGMAGYNDLTGFTAYGVYRSQLFDALVALPEMLQAWLKDMAKSEIQQHGYEAQLQAVRQEYTVDDPAGRIGLASYLFIHRYPVDKFVDRFNELKKLDLLQLEGWISHVLKKSSPFEHINHGFIVPLHKVDKVVSNLQGRVKYPVKVIFPK